MTAMYMTRMMLYTFHGPNRTGEKEREHLHEAPWIMTGPLVVLGVLSVVRRLAQPARAHSARPGRRARALARAGRRRGDAARHRRRGAEAVARHRVRADRRRGRHRGRRYRARLDAAQAGRARAEGAGAAGAGLRARARSTSTTSTRSTTRRSSQPVVGVSRGLLWRGVDNGLIDGARACNGRARVARRAAVVGSGSVRSSSPGSVGHVRLGARRRRARRARRLHASADADAT